MTTPRSPYPRLQRIFYLLSSVYCMVLGTGDVQAQTNEFFGSLEWEQRNAGSLPEFYNGYSLGGGLHSAGWWLGGKWIQNRTFATESQVEVSLFRWNPPTPSKPKPIPMIEEAPIPLACLTRPFPFKQDGELRICGWKEVCTTALS